MINKIFNWTAGSFFRTLGRFIFYGIIVFLLSLLFSVNSSVKASSINFDEIYINNIRMYQDMSIWLDTSANRTMHLVTNVLPRITDVKQYAFISFMSYDELSTYYSSGVSSLVGYDTGIPRNFYNSSLRGTIRYFIFEPNWDCGATGTNCIWQGDIVFWGTTSDYQILDWGFSNEPIRVDTSSGELINQNNQIITQNGQIIEQQQETNDKLDQTNEELGEMNDYIQDDTPASTEDVDLDSLGTVDGLLPEGPVDSLLNIPFTFLSVLTSSMGGVCVPITGTFVFDSTLSIPCFDSFYDEVPDYLMNFINLIPAGFILIMYFKHLYKKVERAVSLQTTTDDEWGVI